MDQVAMGVASGMKEIWALSRDIVSDLDELNGGIKWWGSYEISPDERFNLSDYLIDVVDGVAENLQEAELLLDEYRKKRMTADFQIRHRMRQNGGDPLGRGCDAAEDRQRDLHLKSYVHAFFSALTSVLDTLAGTVVGVAGLDLPIVRSDLAMFDPLSANREYPGGKTRLTKSLSANQSARALQLELVHAFRTSMLQAGPQDWYLWLERKRNQLAHRGGRLQLVAFKRQGRGPDQERFFLMEKDPDLTTVQDFRRNSSKVEDSHLLEDELSLMTGLLSSVNAAVVGTIISARKVWEQRRDNPLRLAQPATQWKLPRPNIDFQGYEPTDGLLHGVTAVLVNPTDAARMNASRVINSSPK